MSTRRPYASDLGNEEWEIVKPLMPPAKHGGRNRSTSIREVLNAIFYVLRTGCAWRLLPHDFPPWQTIYDYFARWRKDGTWKKIHDTLRERLRISEGREREPSAGVIDSQSVKTTEKGGFADTMPAKRRKDGSAT